jgi:hypothetical protein
MEHSHVSAVAERVETGYNGLFVDNDVSAWEMSEALRSFAACERYSNVRLNCLNMVSQHGELYAERAPLYAVDSADYVGDFGPALANARDAADARLFESAQRIATMVNEQTPISISACASAMRTWPDHDPMHGGESYCADEYPDGYAGYQDGPCGDY